MVYENVSVNFFSEILQTETVLILPSIILLVAASFCINHIPTGEKVEHYSEIKSRVLCEKDYKNFSLNDECNHLIDEDIAGCKLSWWYR